MTGRASGSRRASAGTTTSRRRPANPSGRAPSEQDGSSGATSVLVRIGEIGVLVLVMTPIILALLGIALVLVVLGFSMMGS